MQSPSRVGPNILACRRATIIKSELARNSPELHKALIIDPAASLDPLLLNDLVVQRASAGFLFKALRSPPARHHSTRQLVS
jgi:hypothetical protein